MTRQEANKIFAFFDAAFALTLMIAGAAFCLVIIMGVGFADSIALTAGILCFTALMASTATDLKSKRIPNALSLTTLAAGPIWWLALALGSSIAANAGESGMSAILSLASPRLAGASSLVPSISVPWLSDAAPLFATILLDTLAMVLVFLPLYLSFALGFGFGGGDVKLMTAATLFLGWPLGFDFLALTYLFGGPISVFIIVGRKFTRRAARKGKASEKMLKIFDSGDFPYAPAIAASAVVCFAAKFEGLF